LKKRETLTNDTQIGPFRVLRTPAKTGKIEPSRVLLARCLVQEWTDERNHCERANGQHLHASLTQTVDDEETEVEVAGLGKILGKQSWRSCRMRDDLSNDRRSTRGERSNEEDLDYLEPEIPLLRLQFNLGQCSGASELGKKAADDGDQGNKNSQHDGW
jgi:hypothetical protein